MRRAIVVALLGSAACLDVEDRDAGTPGAFDSGVSGSPDAMAPPVDGGVSTRPATCPASAAWVTTVSGVLEESAGGPSTAAKAQLCLRTAPDDALVCLRPADSDATGRFTINVAESARCMNEATMRFVKPNEDRGVSYCHLTLPPGAEVVTAPQPFKIYPTARATSLPPLGDETMTRTVRFADGLELDVVPREYFPGAGTYADLAAGRVQSDPSDVCVQAGQPAFDAIYAFSPEGDNNGRIAARLPNPAGLAANRAVRVYVLGGLGCALDDGTTIPEGEWAEIERGQVSADGRSIGVSPGLPCLSWVAYRAE